MSGKRNVSVCGGHELVNALQAAAWRKFIFHYFNKTVTLIWVKIGLIFSNLVQVQRLRAGWLKMEILAIRGKEPVLIEDNLKLTKRPQI